jgi:hypothetical protein
LIEKHEEMEAAAEGQPDQPEQRIFAPDQMVRCEDCLRANPPTRTSCLYCGAGLPVDESNAAWQRPTLRQLEKWEQGYNTIILPGEGANLSVEDLNETARWLRLSAEDFQSLLSAAQPLPLARSSSLDEAALIERRLAGLGLSLLTLADKDLLPGNSGPQRVRAVELQDEALVLYPTGGGAPSSLMWAELLLLVSGRLFVRQVELEEHRRRGTEHEIVNSSELSADEAVIDLYTARGMGWRVAANNFDFSSLGQRKALVAAENFRTLVQTLRERAPRAKYDDSYMGLRRLLSVVWRLEQRTEAGGWRHGRLGKFNTGSMTITDNETQFTRYSRLRFFLKSNHPELAL